MVISISAQFPWEELSSGFRGNMRFGWNWREYGVKENNCKNIKGLALTTEARIHWRNHTHQALEDAGVQWMVLSSQKMAMDLRWWATELYTLEWKKSETLWCPLSQAGLAHNLRRPSAWKPEAEGSQVRGQPEAHNEIYLRKHREGERTEERRKEDRKERREKLVRLFWNLFPRGFNLLVISYSLKLH